MEFLGNVLGAGCNVDGTSTSNPVVGMADKLFDSLAYSENSAMLASYATGINSETILQDRKYDSMLDQFQSSSLGPTLQSSFAQQHSGGMMSLQHVDPYLAMQMQNQQVNEILKNIDLKFLRMACSSCKCR